jgi:hypothetical protein
VNDEERVIDRKTETDQLDEIRHIGDHREGVRDCVDGRQRPRDRAGGEDERDRGREREPEDGEQDEERDREGE